MERSEDEGREYIDGVILADQREPRRALCVTSFPYDLDRDGTGHCSSLTVSGTGNHVSVDAADDITANGMNNVVTSRVGAPHIATGGIGNVVEPG